MDIKCADSQHPARKNHASVEVRKFWFDGVLATGSKQINKLVCSGCALASQLEAPPAEKTLEERVAALENAGR